MEEERAEEEAMTQAIENMLVTVSKVGQKRHASGKMVENERQ
jgi:hypothetical protein